MVPSKNQIGLKNFAPSSSQLAIAIPAGATSLTISWRQFLGGTGALLGTETTPDKANNIIPLGVLGSFDEPIAWKFTGMSLPSRLGKPMLQAPTKAIFENGRWQYSQSLQAKPCEQSKYYVSLLSYDFKYLLEDINVTFNMDQTLNQANCNFSLSTQEAAEVPPPAATAGCSSTTDRALNIQGLVLLILFARKAWQRMRQKRLYQK